MKMFTRMSCYFTLTKVACFLRLITIKFLDSILCARRVVSASSMLLGLLGIENKNVRFSGSRQ
jgi:hypothetical protein